MLTLPRSGPSRLGPRSRTAALAATAGIVAASLVAAVAPTVLVGALTSAAHATPTPVSGRACAPGEGVTVVVDFAKAAFAPDVAEDRVAIGCAVGEQPNGLAAVRNAGFAIGSVQGSPGAVCQLDSLPTAGYPKCWYDGFWQYWRAADRSASTWTSASTGAGGTGVVPVDSVEGWSFALGSEGWGGPAPRVLPTGLTPYVTTATGLSAPVLSPISADEVLPLSAPTGVDVEVAVLSVGQTDADAEWAPATEVPLTPYLNSDITLLLRRAGSTTVEFRADYAVRASYAPGKGNGTPENPELGVPSDSDDIVGWATGFADYVPGPNVAAQWQTPEKAVGPLAGWADLVVLGDHGTITMTFDGGIGDGPGADLAVYENGFRSGSLDALELATVAVSSNGTDFAHFDSASRRASPVGGFEGQDASLLGGLAGKDLAGLGTPFDLALLRNDPLVVSGAVDLNAITDVKIIDVLGDGNDRDSFGRPLYDPYPTSGSGGFDLTGVAALNRPQEVVDPEPTPEPTPTAPTATPTATPTSTPTQPPATQAPVVTLRASAVQMRAPKSVRRGKPVALRIRVTAPGLVPTGTVRVRFAGATRTVALVDGRARVVLRVKKAFKVGAKGRKVVARVAYAGSSDVASSTGRATVRVRR